MRLTLEQIACSHHHSQLHTQSTVGSWNHLRGRMARRPVFQLLLLYPLFLDMVVNWSGQQKNSWLLDYFNYPIFKNRKLFKNQEFVKNFENWSDTRIYKVILVSLNFYFQRKYNVESKSLRKKYLIAFWSLQKIIWNQISKFPSKSTSTLIITRVNKLLRKIKII